MDNAQNLISYTFGLLDSDNELARVKEMSRVMAFYNQDIDEMTRAIYYFFEKKYYSTKTLDDYVFIFEDVLEKIIGKKTAGIFTQDPKISLRDKDGNPDENQTQLLSEILSKINFIESMKESYKASEYCNTVIYQSVFRDNELGADVITPEYCSVTPKADYFKIKEIMIGRVGANNTPFYSLWTETEHKLIDADKQTIEQEGVLGKNSDETNPYGLLPFSILRRKKQNDFWGEPNWGLFFYQLLHCMNLTDNQRGQVFLKFPMLMGVNAELPDGAIISPGKYLNFKQTDPSIPEPNIKPIDFGTDWASIVLMEKHRQETSMMNQGIPASSASTDTKAMSGAAKTIDELEPEESREDAKGRLWYFMRDSIKNIIAVHNYHFPNKINDKLTIDIQFSEEKIRETETDKSVRRDSQLKLGIKNQIDFIMEDRECSREEAIKYYEDLKAENLKLGLNQAVDTTQTNKPVSMIQRILNPDKTNA